MNKADESINTDEIKKKPTGSKTGKIIWYCLLAVPILWIVLTVIVPLGMGDGLSKYSGEQREYAEAVLNSPGKLIDNKSKWGYSLHIKDVHQATTEEQKQYCPNNRIGNAAYFGHYTIILEIRQLLTLNTTTEAHVGCDFREN